jgi:hypothetical protein
MAKVTKQKNGRYQRSVVVGKDENGKPVRKFFTGKTIKEVDEQVSAFKRKEEAVAPDSENVNSDIVKYSFSEFVHNTYNIRQGGIHAGGDFRASENTTAYPLATLHKV